MWLKNRYAQRKQFGTHFLPVVATLPFLTSALLNLKINPIILLWLRSNIHKNWIDRSRTLRPNSSTQNLASGHAIIIFIFSMLSLLRQHNFHETPCTDSESKRTALSSLHSFSLKCSLITADYSFISYEYSLSINKNILVAALHIHTLHNTHIIYTCKSVKCMRIYINILHGYGKQLHQFRPIQLKWALLSMYYSDEFQNVLFIS